MEISVVQQNLLPKLLDGLAGFGYPSLFNPRPVMPGQANLMLKFAEAPVGIADGNRQWCVDQL